MGEVEYQKLPYCKRIRAYFKEEGIKRMGKRREKK